MNRRDFLKTAGKVAIIAAAPTLFLPKLIEVVKWKRLNNIYVVSDYGHTIRKWETPFGIINILEHPLFDSKGFN